MSVDENLALELRLDKEFASARHDMIHLLRENGVADAGEAVDRLLIMARRVCPHCGATQRQQLAKQAQSRRLRLTVDLSRYGRNFVLGAVGIEGPDYRRGDWGKSQPDRFFPFLLPDGDCIDVLWSSVEVVTDGIV